MNMNSMKMGNGHESNRRFSRFSARVWQSGNFRNPRSHRLDRIMRLILIDNYSGYIFGEFCSSACLVDAARAVDAGTGGYGRAYTVHDRAPGPTATGHELRISAGMSEADRLAWYRSPPVGSLVRYRHAIGHPLRFPVFAGLRDARDI